MVWPSRYPAGIFFARQWSSFSLHALRNTAEWSISRRDQAGVTVDFARRNRVLTWLLGGLNYHKEHHLFPLICHVNYPAMLRVVEETCREFGLPYKEHRSFPAGIASHYRWLRRMAIQD